MKLSGTIRVNMPQFKERWRDNDDNRKLGDTIRLNRGVFSTLDARPYVEELNDAGIFYTVR